MVKEGFAIAPEALIVTRGAGGSHLRKLIGSSIPLHVMHDVNNKIPDLGQCKYIILMGLKRIQGSKKRKKINKKKSFSFSSKFCVIIPFKDNTYGRVK